VACALAVLASASAQAAPAADPQRLARLEAEVVHGEDVSAIKKLNRAYGYYVDAGLWDDLADLFAQDAVANYPNGTWVGRESIRAHFLQNLGGGHVGLEDGRLYVHTVLQPVIHLDPGGQTARGRWRTLAMLGRYGGSASWAEGVYEMGYVKEAGAWKIARLDYYAGFGAPYETGWGQARAPGGAPAQLPRLARPPDRPRPEAQACPGYPAACPASFDYANPVTGGAGGVWPAPEASVAPSARADLGDLSRRAERLADEQAIQNLIGTYGYYLDRGMWDQLAGLFADDGTIEFGQQGVYVGRRRIRAFLGTLGPSGGREGWLFDHLELQPIVYFTPELGYGRNGELAMTGTWQGSGTWAGGIYENVYVKQNGVWRIRALRFSPTFITDYDKGWGKDAQSPAGPSRSLPPDRPPGEAYQIYPKAHIVRFSFTNPATGRPVHYPEEAAPNETLNIPTGPEKAAPGLDLPSAEWLMTRVKAYDEIENLEGAYGYYVDKSLWDDVADLFAGDASLEIGQFGVYVGQDHIRRFLHTLGPQGPQPNRLSNHLQVQPVIDVAADGGSARIRIRFLEQLGSWGQGARWGAVIEENEAVLDGGVWKLRRLHGFSTLSADYAGGWARAANPSLPGPSTAAPPDRPPSVTYQPFPKSYTVPFHAPTPATGNP
jgi:hypothetical protein